MTLRRLAWRNIWRNRRRSAIVLTSIIVGVAALVFTDSLARGFLRQMLQNQLGSHTAHLQIHQRGFRDNPTVQGFMEDDGRAAATLSAGPGVLHVSRRIVVFGLLSSASTSSGVTLVGVDPVAEPRVTTIAASVVTGSYLTGAPREIVLGKRLAGTLGVGIGDKVVAMASASDGRVGTELFRVTGLYVSSSSEFDRMYVYVPLEDARRMLRVEGRIAGLAAVLRDPSEAPALRDSLARRLGEHYEVLSYQDLLPSLLSQMEVSEQSMFIIYLIIGIGLIFGIVNTLLMSVFERIHEFGVLKALGMKDRTLFALIVLESLWLGVLGTGAGALLALGIHLPLSRSGLNFAAFAEGLAAWGAGAVITPVMDPGGVLVGLLVILAVCVIAALYPAWRAARLLPINAIRHV